MDKTLGRGKVLLMDFLLHLLDSPCAGTAQGWVSHQAQDKGLKSPVPWEGWESFLCSSFSLFHPIFSLVSSSKPKPHGKSSWLRKCQELFYATFASPSRGCWCSSAFCESSFQLFSGWEDKLSHETNYQGSKIAQKVTLDIH